LRKLLFVVNTDKFFHSHRLPIALEAAKQGYEIHVACNITSHDLLTSHGFIVHPIRLDRSSSGVVSNLATLIDLIKVFNLVSPDIVHLVTIKPVVLGGIAARLSNIPAVVFAISGLGHAFSPSRIFAKFRRGLIVFLYRLCLRQNKYKVIFQNESDLELLSENCDIPIDKTCLIPGSGVDLNLYHETPMKSGVPVVILASRLLIDKGVREFAYAAKSLVKDSVKARFVLIGDIDPDNPSSLLESEISQWVDDGFLEWWGYCDEMYNIFPMSHIVTLPSYYGEGMPKVLLEAAACGRAIVTSNHPGCRDAIESNVTGLLVPVKDGVNLMQAIKFLLDNPDVLKRMGKQGRYRAERCFNIDEVVSKHLDIYSSFF